MWPSPIFRRPRVELPIDELNEAPAPGDLEAETLRRLQFRQLSRLLAELPDRERELLVSSILMAGWQASTLSTSLQS